MVGALALENSSVCLFRHREDVLADSNISRRRRPVEDSIADPIEEIQDFTSDGHIWYDICSLLSNTYVASACKR